MSANSTASSRRPPNALQQEHLHTVCCRHPRTASILQRTPCMHSTPGYKKKPSPPADGAGSLPIPLSFSSAGSPLLLLPLVSLPSSSSLSSSSLPYSSSPVRLCVQAVAESNPPGNSLRTGGRREEALSLSTEISFLSHSLPFSLHPAPLLLPPKGFLPASSSLLLLSFPFFLTFFVLL